MEYGEDQKHKPLLSHPIDRAGPADPADPPGPPTSEDISSVGSTSDIISPIGTSAYHPGTATSITSYDATSNKSQRSKPSMPFGQGQTSPSRLGSGTDQYGLKEANQHAEALVSELSNVVSKIRRPREPLSPKTLRLISKALMNAIDDVQEQLEHYRGGRKSTWAGSTVADEGFSFDPILSYTPILDEYLDKVGDLDLARERYEYFLLQLHGWLKEEEDRQHGLGQGQEFESSGGKDLIEDGGWEMRNKLELVQGIQKAFSEVQIWEQKCIEENSLATTRDLHEPFELVSDPTGKSVLCSFLKPSPHWHDRLDAGVFQIRKEQNFDLPLPPTPPPPLQDPPLPPTHPPAPAPSLALHTPPVLTPQNLPLPPTPPLPSLSPINTLHQSESRSLPSIALSSTTPLREIVQAAIKQEKNSAITSDSQIHHVTYELTWELPVFFAAHMAPGTKLGSCLTVTGGSIDAFATSCREYVSIFWQEAGLLLLDALEKLLAPSPSKDLVQTIQDVAVDASNEQISILISQDAEIAQKLSIITLQGTPISDRDAYTSRAKIESRAKLSDQVDIAATLRWLCSAIRHSSDGLKLSTATVSYDRTAPNAKIIIAPNILDDRGFEDSCWHALFKHQVIASEFPIPERRAGKGLEISYANMVIMARSLELVEVYGGLVAEGLSTLLIPTLTLNDAGEHGVQWHLIIKPNVEALTSDILDSLLPESWHRELNPDILSSRKAFLGWTPSAVVTLGTMHSHGTIHQVRTSGLSEIAKSGLSWSHGGGVALNIKVVTVTGTATAIPSSITSAIAIEDGATIESRLRNAAERRQVILYDNEAEVGWHISRASLILYLAQVNIAHRREQSSAPKVFAEASPNGGLAAFRAIHSSWMWDIPDENYAFERLERPRKFSWLIERIVFRLQKVEEVLMKTQIEAFKVGKRPPKSIIGVELLDVAYFQERVSIKEKEVNQAWAHLTDQDTLVLFCKELGQVIQPCGSQYLTEALCREWTTVHKKANYLVSTGPTLMYLFENNSLKGIPRLSKSIQWLSSPKQPLFALHKYDEPSVCNHIQKLKATESVDKESELRVAKFVGENINAAYIFWDGSKKILKTTPIIVTRPLEQIQSRAHPVHNSLEHPQAPPSPSVIRPPALRLIRDSPVASANIQSSNRYRTFSANRDKLPVGSDDGKPPTIPRLSTTDRAMEIQRTMTSAKASLISRRQDISIPESRSSSPGSSSSQKTSDLDSMSSPPAPLSAPSKPISGTNPAHSKPWATTMSTISGSTTLRPSSSSLRSTFPEDGRTSPRTLRREVRKIPSIQESNIAIPTPAQKSFTDHGESTLPKSTITPRPVTEHNSSASEGQLWSLKKSTDSERHSEKRQSDSSHFRRSIGREKEKLTDMRGRREELSSGRRRRHSTSTTAGRDQNRQQEKDKQNKGKKSS